MTGSPFRCERGAPRPAFTGAPESHAAPDGPGEVRLGPVVDIQDAVFRHERVIRRVGLVRAAAYLDLLNGIPAAARIASGQAVNCEPSEDDAPGNGGPEGGSGGMGPDGGPDGGSPGSPGGDGTGLAPRLAELAATGPPMRSATGPPDTPSMTRPPGPASWSFTLADSLRPPDGPGTWTLTVPDGRQLTVHLERVPTLACDHRHESHAYQPNDTLRHLVQVRLAPLANPGWPRLHPRT